MASRSTRKLATILFSDMVGYSALVGRDEKLAFRLLQRQKKLVRSVLPKFAGREVEVIGDAFLVEFNSALLAAQCALAIHQRLAALAPEQADDPPIVLRIALHLGDIETPGKRVYGDTVNIAARLQELAPQGGIALSAPVHHQIEGHVALPFQSIGRPALKNIARPLEVFTVDAAAIQAAPRQEDATALTGQRPRRRLGVAVALAAVALVGAALYWFASRPAPVPVPAAAQEDNSVAVMPLRNESGDAKYEYFSDGLSEDLINALAQLKGLRVISRNSSFQFKNKSDDAATIGAKLHVTHLLEGSVRRQGGRVRITAELVQCAGGAAVWTHQFDRELKDVMAVQAEIAARVAEQLRPQLVGASTATATNSPPHNNLAAYDAYLKGNFLFAPQQLMRDEKVITRAVEQYREALRLEPDYAAAQAKLSQALASLGNLHTASVGAAYLKEARALAFKSLELAPDLADAHAAVAYVYDFLDWNFPAAEVEYRKALQIAPNNGFALWHLHLILGLVLKPEQAYEVGRQAIALDPLLSEHYDNLAWTYADYGRYADSERLLRLRRELFPEDDGLHATTSHLADLRGEMELAISEADKVRGVAGGCAKVALRQSGADRAAADAAFHQLSAKAAADSPYCIAAIYARRKEDDNAFEWLARSYKVRDASIIYLAEDPEMRNLHPDPRFAAMCKKVGLPVPPASAHG